MHEDDKSSSRPLLFLLPASLIALHIPFLKLPFHWDEMGQFVPAALDIYREGRWVPRTTLPNVHPPGLMAAVALVWQVFGFSILASRLAMLIIASIGVVLCFVLTKRLSRAHTPALVASLFLIASPIFYTQSMMVLLDMPAMTLTLVALLLFLDGRYVICAAACTCLVLLKETAITAPAVFAGWLWFRGQQPLKAFYFLMPAAALGFWLMTLHSVTGHWLGNEEFAQYNVGTALEPFHIGFAILSRVWYLFFAEGRFIGTVALLLGWRLLRETEWTIAFLVAGTQLLVVTVLGGAELERYVVPILPILYAAMATAASSYQRRWQLATNMAMLACLIAGSFWSTPFPWPYEDNLDLVDCVRLQQDAARYLEASAPSARIASAWPFTDALLHPEFGYVKQPLKALKAPELHVADIARLGRENFDLLVMFTNKRPVKGSWLDVPPLRGFLRHYYDYEPQAPAEEIRKSIGFVPIKRWRRRDQWIEIYAPANAP
jgi:4-amino-4-deoxy-L-arabinose transferase-like glycosyltransferase